MKEFLEMNEALDSGRFHIDAVYPVPGGRIRVVLRRNFFAWVGEVLLTFVLSRNKWAEFQTKRFERLNLGKN